MDDYLKALGVGMIGRTMVNKAKPRLTISESNGQWKLLTDGGIKSKTVEFEPNVEYERTAEDGRKLKVLIFI